MSVFTRRATAEEVTTGIDLVGKVVFITGVNSGIGFETMRVLAMRGAHVIGTARTLEKAQEACKQVSGKLTPMECELESRESIHQCAQEIALLHTSLDVCIANAGIMALAKRELVNGIEKQFAVNHLGHFMLVNLLRPSLEAKEGSRLVVVSSEGHRLAPSGGIQFDDLGAEQRYGRWRAYGQSKLANILFAKAFARRASSCTANVVHPGTIETNLGRNVNPVVVSVLGGFMKLGAKSIPQGAATTCYVATSPELKGVTGKYFDNCSVREPSRWAQDEALSERLWEVSAKLTGVEMSPQVIRICDEPKYL